MPPKMSHHASPRASFTPKHTSNGMNSDGSSMNNGRNKIGSRSSIGALNYDSGSSMRSLLYDSSSTDIYEAPDNPMRPGSWGGGRKGHVTPPAPQEARGHQTLPFGTQNQHNMLGDRPSVRQSKIYRQNESGNAMKSLLGVENLAWNTEKQQGAYEGMGVFDAGPQRGSPSGKRVHWPGQQPLRQLPVAGSEHEIVEAEYPFPGSRATCDGCGDIVMRFYHCVDCHDPEVFDLCAKCCAAVYLPASKRPPSLVVPHIEHPTHDLQSHRMELVSVE